MLKNTPNSFGTIAKTFHWIIALGILGMLIVGFIMVDREASPAKMMMYGLHKSTGAVILLLVTLRLGWRLLNPIPQLPSTLKPWHHWIARLSPVALYILMVTMPLSGFVMSDAAGHPVTLYNIYTLPSIFSQDLELSKAARSVHVYTAYMFVAILVLHVSAALYHHYILKTNILRRMLPSWVRLP